MADADNELASAILETLAANRGKTLYCALDQSDTWTKRQVYDNAHAHNDRDRTQYDGSQGQGRFRGFTAAQEGWLTDGEHGITGVSPERIFEFPNRKRKADSYTWKRHSLSAVLQYGFPDNLPAGKGHSKEAIAEANARDALIFWVATGDGPGRAWLDDWEDNRQSRAQAHAQANCKDLNYPIARSVTVDYSRWYYSADQDSGANYQFQASLERPYTATCYKRVRRNP